MRSPPVRRDWSCIIMQRRFHAARRCGPPFATGCRRVRSRISFTKSVIIPKYALTSGIRWPYWGRKQGSGILGAGSSSGSRRREKTPPRNGRETCVPRLPRARAQSGARTAPAPTGALARARYARKRVPPPGKAGGGENGSKRDREESPHAEYAKPGNRDGMLRAPGRNDDVTTEETTPMRHPHPEHDGT